MALGKRKLFIIVTALAVVGVVVGVVVWQTGGSSKASTKSGGTSSDKSSSSLSSDSTTTNGGTVHASNSSAGSSADDGSATKITSDPAKQTWTLSAYAIGDWGTTIGRESCCKRRAGYVATNTDKNAEDVVAALMGKAAAAANPKPKAIISHGDNFYWVGIIDETDKAHRFDAIFEQKFSAPSLAGIPWVNVMGNHDYGGASYICDAGGQMAPCKGADGIVAGLKRKFELQSTYESPNQGRWILKDHFYVHSISDPASGVSMDIFNIDNNDADSHGLQEVCCQCYSYSDGKDSSCTNVASGDKLCVGGDVAMYKACADQLKAWGDDSRKQLVDAVKKSTATWKVVNAHFSPYDHYAEARMKVWWDVLKELEGSVQLFLYGHSHGEKHDYSSTFKMHFIENGAGGGILFESASSVPAYAADKVKEMWAYGPYQYGFFDLYASKDWLRARFVTYDESWNVQDSFGQSTIGNVAYKYCYYIPADGSKGKKCSA